MTCAANPAAPSGYQVWRKAAVPQVLTQWAVSLRDREMRTSPYGATWPLYYDGQTILARKDHHTWTYKAGELVTGICIPGITLYAPVAPGAVSAEAAGDPLATPDPTAAVYPSDRGVDWGLVAASGTAAVATVAAFLLALRLAARPERRRRAA